ncbi:MAG TPA: gamma-glutamyl-gamma-aminobutyrate hydrolase family protein [Thermomicrobiales bacterium]|nr:gamma-glutamyl-gamma-aminobutyrate hydrolase family protein [Thermomicrobiales bacterium]
MVKSPVIGITAGLMTEEQDYGTVTRHRVSADYSEAVLAAGGLPIILPPQDGTIDAILELVDGLIFSGGADIDPALYGDTEVHPATYDISAARDRFEIDLMKGAVARDLPVLCICRGIQVLNVALGGSLVQHIDDQIEESLTHRQQEAAIAANQPSHQVTLVEGSLTARVFDAAAIPVNSFHHQSIAAPANQVRVEGVTGDGVVEAVSVPSCRFVLGVQWHPEMLFKSVPEQLKPFEGLVTAARAALPEPAGV